MRSTLQQNGVKNISTWANNWKKSIIIVHCAKRWLCIDDEEKNIAQKVLKIENESQESSLDPDPKANTVPMWLSYWMLSKIYKQ